eukprot:3375945-Alexandrium_andersonii.AAC.1
MSVQSARLIVLMPILALACWRCCCSRWFHHLRVMGRIGAVDALSALGALDVPGATDFLGVVDVLGMVMASGHGVDDIDALDAR